MTLSVCPSRWAIAAVLGASLMVSSLPVNAQEQQPSGERNSDADVRAVELPGSGQIPATPHAAPSLPAHGDVSFNFPGADARVVAKAVLGDILHLPYAVAPNVNAQVTAVTPYPIARTAVRPFLEDALRGAGLALVRQNGVYTVMPVEQAKASGPLGGEGFASEVIHLQYVGAAQLKALIDPVLPAVVTSIDAGANTITLTGTSGQRASARNILSQFDVNWLRNMSFALFVPQRSDARLIVPELDKLINAPDAPTRSMVRLIAMEKLNGILAVTAQSQYLTDVRRWIEVLDREGQNNEEQLFVYRVQNGRSKDLTKTLNMAFGMGSGSSGPADSNSPGGANSGSSSMQSPTGTANPTGLAIAPAPVAGAAPAGGTRRLNATISSDDNNNAVVIYGTPHDYGIVLAALRKLDVAPTQVMLEAAITEVTLTNDMGYGVQWQFSGSGLNGVQTRSATLPDQTQVTANNLPSVAPGLSLLFTHGTNIAAMLTALQTRTKVNVVSAPKLMVMNNQTAALQVGDQVPILTQSATNTVAGSATINSIDYRDTGVILKITPRVNEGGLVMLDISQEVSTVGKTTTSGISSPTISTRKIATSVAVQDGEVIGLGGMITDNDVVTKSGVPVVSQIPILGSLFGNHSKTRNRTELIVLIKPKVIRSADDERDVTEELRAALKGTTEMMKISGATP